ncbi:MAG TPA: class I SAM-dependent methyltransferase [Hyphomicrobium sp.]|nr:class I SAM-dependent methyltransferase [Hyphomicrobium sp.]
MQQSEMERRIVSEREFHDRRYVDGDNRVAQLKYYWSIDAGSRRFLAQMKEFATNSDVLEYGCGSESRAGELEGLYRSFTGIDISDVAIARLKERYPATNVSFSIMDAMNMTFADRSFDLIYGSGIVHHLDIDTCAREVSRVLRSGGRALFWEPLGYNPLINIYRWLTPGARTADEHPLVGHDFSVMKQHFRSVEIELYGLTSIAAVPIQRFVFGESMRDLFARIDNLLLKVPGVRMLAWYSIIRCTN